MKHNTEDTLYRKAEGATRHTTRAAQRRAPISSQPSTSHARRAPTPLPTVAISPPASTASHFSSLVASTPVWATVAASATASTKTLALAAVLERRLRPPRPV